MVSNESMGFDCAASTMFSLGAVHDSSLRRHLVLQRFIARTHVWTGISIRVSTTTKTKNRKVTCILSLHHTRSPLSFRCIISRCSSLSDSCWRLALDSCRRLAGRQGWKVWLLLSPMHAHAHGSNVFVCMRPPNCADLQANDFCLGFAGSLV